MARLCDFLRDLDATQKRDLAEEAETTPAYLEQLAGGHRRPSYALSQRLVRAANKLGHQLSLNDCRPDIWKERVAA
jgi:predicted transcriptional regulator